MLRHDMVAIPCGVLSMGTTEEELDAIEAAQHLPREWFEDEAPVHSVELAHFAIDRHPVTNSQYAAFVDSTGYRTVAEQRGFGLVYGRDFWEETGDAYWLHPVGPEGAAATERPDHPVVHMAWADAEAYADWAGFRLPTEAEWEYAACGPSSHIWPWGNEWDPAVNNSAEHWSDHRIHDMGTWRNWWLRHHSTGPLPATTPVGAFPAGDSVFGVSDMAGNVQEWTASTYGPYDKNRSYGDIYTRIFGVYKVLRGGSWMHYKFQSRCSERIAADSFQYSNFSTGFRCAADGS
ncbi:formylglycine-generating enzyme family protein [Streptomyces sp. DSM 41987]|uniref:formylglycine-generating enzyme family protein n=1 Tax=Streptomyces TaxID=1883 RepID=UPI00361ECB25